MCCSNDSACFEPVDIEPSNFLPLLQRSDACCSPLLRSKRKMSTSALAIRSILRLFGKINRLRPNKKVSALTNMAQIFTGGWSVFFFFFCWKFFTHKSGMPTSTFQEQGTVTLVASVHVAARRTSLPESPRPRVCWTVGHIRVTSLSPLSRASLAWAPLYHVRRWCEKRHGAGLLLLRQVSGIKMRSVEFKDSLSTSATRNTESNVASSSRCKRRVGCEELKVLFRKKKSR